MLVEQLDHHGGFRVGESAAEALAEMMTDADEPTILEWLRHDSVRRRHIAYIVAGRFALRSAVPALLEQLLMDQVPTQDKVVADLARHSQYPISRGQRLCL